MKKIITAAALLASLLFSLSALGSCGTNETGDKLSVIGSVFPPYDFAREIGGDRIKCEMLLRPGADSHSYSGDDPNDIYRISRCDLFIYVGGESDEAWVSAIKEKIEKTCDEVPVFLALTDACDLLEESGSGIVQNDEEGEEEVDAEYDEHVWTSPSNAEKACGSICAAMEELDPDNKEFYEQRLNDYTAKLKELDEGFLEAADGAKNKKLVFADRFPFRYLADELGLECFAAFNGCASQSEPSPTTIARLCGIVEGEGLPCVYYIETSQSSVPETIARYTGCDTLLLHSCHTVTQRELDGGATYLSLMKQNLENLKKGLGYGE